MFDGNGDMRLPEIAAPLAQLSLCEVIIEKHGKDTPETYRRNNNKIPIDGIWTSPGISIENGGYFDYDVLIPDTDHHTLWIDISYIVAFGYIMPQLLQSSPARLRCTDPRIVSKYNSHLERFIQHHNLLTLTKQVETQASYPLPRSQQKKLEWIDKMRCTGVDQKIKDGQCSLLPSPAKLQQTHPIVKSTEKKRNESQLENDSALIC
jgi:hypothetical protein